MGTITEQTNGRPIDDETQAKTNLELTREVAYLKSQLREMAARLWGDEELRAKWAEAKRLNVCPNIDEPPPGELKEFDLSLQNIAAVIGQLQNLVDRKLIDTTKQLDFVNKVGAWIGPLMDHPDFRPPLNGDQIASKRFVDESMQRFANAFREELAPVIRFVTTLHKLFSQDIEIAAVTWNMQPVDPLRKKLAVLDEIANRLHASWQWVLRADREASKPGALERIRQAARYAITGRQTGR